MNTFIGNIQSNINHLYRLVKKRDLPLFLSEQEWRINHRYSGKRIMDNEKGGLLLKLNKKLLIGFLILVGGTLLMLL